MKPQIDFSRRALVPRSKVPALAAAATIFLLAGVALSLFVGDVAIPTLLQELNDPGVHRVQ